MPVRRSFRSVRLGVLAVFLLAPASSAPAAQPARPQSEEIRQIGFAGFETTVTLQSDGFEEYGWFTLGAESKGVDPLTQEVRLSVGTFAVTIPAGSFKPLSGQTSAAAFTFEGTIAGTWMDVTLSQIEDKSFELKVEGRGEPAMEIVRPEFVTLMIGSNVGSLISAEVEKDV